MPRISRNATTSPEQHKPVMEKTVEDISIPKDRVYLLPGKISHMFSYPLLGADGAPIPETDGKGNPKWNKNSPVYRMQTAQFSPASGYPEKTICIYLLKANDPEYFAKLKVLEAERTDPANMIMDNETYERYRNPDAAAARIENRKLREENAAKDDLLKKVQEENAALKELLEGKTNPDG